MKRRNARTALRERDLTEAGSRAAETFSEVAENAVAVAREVGRAATPALQHSAEGLSRALERAGEALAVTAERLAKSGEQQAADATEAARERLADASERLADAIRPKRRKHHRVRNTAIALVAVGGFVALVQSPLRAKLTERLFGPPPDDEPDSITLPGSELRTESAPESQPTEPAGPPPSSQSPEGNGVPSAQGGRIDAAPG